MRPRYLLLAGETGAGDSKSVDRLARATKLRPAFSAGHIAALVNDGCTCLPVGGCGCILGTLFHRHGRAQAIAALGDADAHSILESSGAALVARFWGGYVAAIPAKGAVRITRDPSAALPCYYSRVRGTIAFASDAELLVDAGLTGIDLDWDGIAQHFYGAGVPTAATGLLGVGELLAGFALSVPGSVQAQQGAWSPWDHVHQQADNAMHSAERLARTVRHCVSSWASAHGPLLASVSGGLDSSIVAASLAQCGANVTCLTLYGDDPSGDERPYARALCAHLGLQLIERPYRIEDIDPEAALGGHLPRPSDRTHAQSYEQAHLEVAREVGASAFITGNGGDSIFGYSQSAAAAADRYLAEGLGTGFLDTLRDVSLQTGCGVLKAAASALRIARGPRAYSWRPDPLFLNPVLVSSMRNATAHPWLDAPGDALPGKAAHIASILRMQQCLEPSRGRFLPVINPLMSQPVMEVCLGVPSWKWRAGGRDRSLARRAFRNDLPALILQRRLKGGPDGFAARILERLRDAIRERLLEGHLARREIIDRASIERELRQERPVGGEQRARLFEFVAAEAWIDSWLARKRLPSAKQSASAKRG